MSERRLLRPPRRDARHEREDAVVLSRDDPIWQDRLWSDAMGRHSAGRIGPVRRFSLLLYGWPCLVLLLLFAKHSSSMHLYIMNSLYHAA